MSDEYRVIVQLEKNGVALNGMPLIRRLIVNEDADILQIATPDSNTSTFHPLAAATMPTLQIFLLTTDQAINLELNENNPVPLNANSLVLIFGTAMAQSPPTDNIEYNNPSSTVSANLTGTVAGS